MKFYMLAEVMSKFLNKTEEGPDPRSRGPRPVAEKIDVRERLDEADEAGTMERETIATASHVVPLRGQAGGDEVARPLDAWRLQDCRKIGLARGNPKSLLAKEYNADLQAAVEAYRTLRTRLLSQQAKRGLRSLAISGTTPGEGKTLTSLNLALCCSHLPDRSVLLVDGDLRTKGLSKILGLQQLPGLGDLLESGRAYPSAILRTDFSNLCVLPAGTSTMPSAELFSREGWKEFVAWGRTTFDMILVDSPPILDLADTELILSACDGMLLVMRAGTTKRQDLTKVLDELDPKKLVGVVFNGSNDANASRYYQYK
jgi:capsular exopolysaccharide synthesis family protein